MDNKTDASRIKIRSATCDRESLLVHFYSF